MEFNSLFVPLQMAVYVFGVSREGAVQLYGELADEAKYTLRGALKT
jgi:hypothetical protein